MKCGDCDWLDVIHRDPVAEIGPTTLLGIQVNPTILSGYCKYQAIGNSISNTVCDLLWSRGRQKG